MPEVTVKDGAGRVYKTGRIVLHNAIPIRARIEFGILICMSQECSVRECKHIDTCRVLTKHNDWDWSE